MKPLLPALALAAGLLLPGCDDPTPIFGGGWPPPGGGSDPGSLGAVASPPNDGEWIASGVPVLQEALPSGTNVASTSPLVLRFSESISSEGLDSAFELMVEDGFAPTPVTVSQVGDGRMLVITPATPLDADKKYILTMRDGSELLDLTGQTFSTAGNLVDFTVASTDPTDVKLVATWPPADAVDQSPIGELTAVFDRPLLTTSVTDDSFVVTVDGLAPAFDPAPSALEVTVGIFPGQDTRVWRWISLDGEVRADLGASTAVALELSAPGHAIADLTGATLPHTTVSFTTAALSPPSGGALLPLPGDAIGIANLTAGHADELILEIDYPGALTGDVLGIYLFGTSTGEDPVTIAFEREVTVAADGVQTVVTLAELDLVATAAPLAARFADGVVAVAFHLRRGSLTTPMRNLDVDVADGIQDPILDTVAPELLEVFGEDGLGGGLASDLRDMVVSGLASEELRAVEVSTALGDNGAEAPVLGASADGGFLAAPVALDVVDPASLPLAYTMTIYDRAMNPAEVVHAGTFEQRGVVGPTAVVPGAALDVEVYDAVTLLPIDGARVFTHSFDGATNPSVAFGTTGADGKATPASSGTHPTILTVEATGYGIVSLVGVDAERVSVPLEPTLPGLGVITGSVTAGSDLAELTLAALNMRYGDPRRPLELSPFFAGAACTTFPFGGGGLDCSFGPESVRAGRAGALSMLAGNFLLPQGSFSAASALQAFELSLPLSPLSSLPLQLIVMEATLLGEPGAPIADLAVELPATVLDAAGLAGVDTAGLETDPGTAGDPWVSATALVPGLHGALPVGVGLSYDQGADLHDLRTAVSGAVLTGGSLEDVVDTDLFLAAGLRDLLGASSFRRARVSDLGSLPTPNELELEDAPTITSPLPLASTVVVDYDIELTNALPDALGLPGLYRVTVVGEAGRTWRIWLEDPADGSTPTAPLVDLAAAGGTGLVDGTHTARADAFAAPGVSLGDLVWSDLERLWEVMSASAPTAYSVP